MSSVSQCRLEGERHGGWRCSHGGDALGGAEAVEEAPRRWHTGMLMVMDVEGSVVSARFTQPPSTTVAPSYLTTQWNDGQGASEISRPENLIRMSEYKARPESI